jgi:hypothetical protein
MFNYEKAGQPPISRGQFILRLLRTLAVIGLFIGISLGIGMFCYSWLEGLGPVDAFLNASMILGGMGPVDPMKTDAGKIFAGIYALYSGLAFLVMAGFIFGPIAHRILHRFHYEADEDHQA